MSRNLKSTIPVTRNHLQAKLVDAAQFKRKTPGTTEQKEEL